MVHLIPIFLRVNSLRYTRAWDDFEFISWGFFNIILGILGAYMLYIIFESPINSLEKLFFRPDDKKHKAESSMQTDQNGNSRTEKNKEEDNHRNIRTKHTNLCSRHAVETMHNEHLPSMSTFAAYKLRSCSLSSSGFSDVSNYSLGNHFPHQMPHEDILRRNSKDSSKRTRM